MRRNIDKKKRKTETTINSATLKVNVDLCTHVVKREKNINSN